MVSKQTQVLIKIWILGNPECLRSVADRFKITKSILFRVYRRICGAITNNLSGQYVKYLLVSNWAPLGKMINFGSFAQRNALDQWSNDPSLDHADQWTDESLSRVDLIDHWSENGFARKERHRSEILIRILPKERSLKVEIYCFIWWSCLDKVRRFFLSFHSSSYFFDSFAHNKFKYWILFWFCSEHWDAGFIEVKYWKSSRF